MVIAGIIKYLERTRTLYLASLDKFKESTIRERDSSKHIELVVAYPSTRGQRSLIQVDGIEEEALGEKELLWNSYYFFELLKGLIVDLYLTMGERQDSRGFFPSRTPEDALRVILTELNFIYEVLYTKVVFYSRLYI
ncbi:hypothetical protein CDL15_Pgr016990 [Punica granatum]|nr:hypothetical protein CDL15_Pgr016990 [Punica granatum]